MLIDDSFLDRLLRQALLSDRYRYAYLLHKTPTSPSQRMFNALLPQTRIPIHRHPNKDETYVIVKGHICVCFYNIDGSIISSYELSMANHNKAIVIPQGQWHSVKVLEPSVIFEVCDGPYVPLNELDILEIRA